MTGDSGDTDPEGRVSRRGLLKWGGAIGIAVAVPAVGTALSGPAVAAQTGPSTAVAAGAAPLSAEQNAVLEAFVERLIPEDATGPGAIEAGVATFIARSLEGGLAGGLSKLVPLYTANLSAVDAYAMTAYGGAFTSLSAAIQDAVLTDIESGKATGFTPDSATFFATIREHTLEGMFSDPAYGGNQNYAGWELIGYPGVRMPVPAGDQVIGANVKPALASTYAHGQYPAAKREAVA
jgi:gluconate 2-dehydrogenase gamma chain